MDQPCKAAKRCGGTVGSIVEIDRDGGVLRPESHPFVHGRWDPLAPLGAETRFPTVAKLFPGEGPWYAPLQCAGNM